MRVAAANAGLRVAGLGSRFVLSVFMARYMTIRDIGIFALMAGVTGLLPSAAGFGLNFFVGRQLVGLEHQDAIALVRNRIQTSFIAGLTCVAIIGLVYLTGWVVLPLPVWTAAGICLFELLGFDMQIALLARGRPTLANINLLFRTGIWVLPFIVCAFFLPAFRSIGILGWFWLAGLALCHVFMMIIYRRDLMHFLRGILTPQRSYLSIVGWRSLKIYASDIGLAGSIYLDRFLITALVGVSQAGVYFFFSSIVSSAYVISLAASVQIYQPQLRHAFMKGGAAALGEAIGPRLKSTIAIACITLIGCGPALWLVIKFTNKPELSSAFDLVPILLLSFGIKVVSEFYSTVLAAAERDNNYAIFNLAGLLISFCLGLITIPIMGFRGAAVALFVASSIVAVARIWCVRALVRREVMGGLQQ